MPDPQDDNNRKFFTKQDLDLTPFDTKFCDLKTKCIFENWSTIAAIRILVYVQSRKGKAIYSIRGIAQICRLHKSTVAETLKLLVDKEYLLQKGNRFFANTQFEMSSLPDSSAESVQGKSKSVQNGSQSVQPTRHNNQRITKKITNYKNPNLSTQQRTAMEALKQIEAEEANETK